MNVDNDNDLFLSAWTWIAVLALFSLIWAAVVYGFSTSKHVKIGIDDNRPLSLAESRTVPEASPYAYPPPKSAFGPWKDDEVKHASKPDPQEAKVAQKIRQLEKEATERQIKEMFPLGSIDKPAPKAGPMPQAKSQPREVFPSVACGGRQWRSTGRFVASEQLDLIPSNCSLGGRSLYALAGSGDNPGVLFVQSLNDPNKYAVYR